MRLNRIYVPGNSAANWSHKPKLPGIDGGLLGGSSTTFADDCDDADFEEPAPSKRAEAEERRCKYASFMALCALL